jgi:hypothetical protein
MASVSLASTSIRQPKRIILSTLLEVTVSRHWNVMSNENHRIDYFI